MKNYQKGIDQAIQSGAKFKDYRSFCKNYKYNQENFYSFIMNEFHEDAVDHLASLEIIPSRKKMIISGIEYAKKNARQYKRIFEFLSECTIDESDKSKKIDDFDDYFTGFPFNKTSISLFYEDLLSVVVEEGSLEVIDYLTSKNLLKTRPVFMKYQKAINNAVKDNTHFNNFDEFCKHNKIKYEGCYNEINSVLGSYVPVFDAVDYLSMINVIPSRDELIIAGINNATENGLQFDSIDEFRNHCMADSELNYIAEKDSRGAFRGALLHLYGDDFEDYLISKGVIKDSKRQLIEEGIAKATKRKKKFQSLYSFEEFCNYEFYDFEDVFDKLFGSDPYTFLSSKGIIVGEQGKIIEAVKKAKIDGRKFDTLADFTKQYKVKVSLVNDENTSGPAGYDDSCFGGDVAEYLYSNGLIPSRKDIILHYVDKAKKEGETFDSFFDFTWYCGEINGLEDGLEGIIKNEFKMSGLEFLKKQGIVAEKDKPKPQISYETIRDLKNMIKAKVKNIKSFDELKKNEIMEDRDYMTKLAGGVIRFYTEISREKNIKWDDIDVGKKVIIEPIDEKPELYVKNERGRILGSIRNYSIGGEFLPIVQQGIVSLDNCQIAFNEALKRGSSGRSTRFVYVSFDVDFDKINGYSPQSLFDDYSCYTINRCEMPVERMQIKEKLWPQDFYSGISNAVFRGLKPQINAAIDYAADQGILLYSNATQTPGVYEMRTTKIYGSGRIAEYIQKIFPELKMVAFSEYDGDGCVVYSAPGCSDDTDVQYISGIDHHNEVEHIYLYTNDPDGDVKTKELNHIAGYYDVNYRFPYSKEWNSFNYLVENDGYWAEITGVTIPEGVEEIGDYAYAYSDSLKEIVIPESVKKISKKAFIGSEKLEKPIIRGGIFGWKKDTLILNATGKTALNWKTAKKAEKTKKEKMVEIPNKNEIEGMKFAVSGQLNSFPDMDAIKAYIEDHGGKMSSTVSSLINYLVTNSPDSNDFKTSLARELGVKIITEEELLNM